MPDLQQLDTQPDDEPLEVAGGLGRLLRPTLAMRRQHRRLPERILVAAHQACDIGELDVADHLLSVLDGMLVQGSITSPAAHRRVVEGMVAAYERLWHLRRRPAP